MDLLEITQRGLYCRAGDFYVDPWEPVDRAVITHAHSDHARTGSRSYLAAAPGHRVLRARLGQEANIQCVAYHDRLTVGEATVSLHPAGHILGSAQVRIEAQGQVWVISGDYKLESDITCCPFELVPCNVFVTEATFALPIYHWQAPQIVFDDINSWWRQNREQERASILFAYALGKAQRVLAGIDADIGPIFTHGSVERLTEEYRNSGVVLPATQLAVAAPKADFSGSLILAPPMPRANPWLRRFGDYSSAMASGHMQIRGTRRRLAIDRGFVLSDHADWPALLSTIRATGAETIWVTHGQTAPLVRWLQEAGWNARHVPTHFEGESDETGLAGPEAGNE